MDLELKKDIFLIILDTIFSDKSAEINKSNCVSFYHFLVDTLIEEIVHIPEGDDDEIFLCDSIIELLCNFDIMGSCIEDWEPSITIDFLQEFSGLNNVEYEVLISKFIKIYTLIKNDFILGLT